jgi:hypothetical protein
MEAVPMGVGREMDWGFGGQGVLIRAQAYRIVNRFVSESPHDGKSLIGSAFQRPGQDSNLRPVA